MRRRDLMLLPAPLLAQSGDIKLIIIGDDIGALHAIGEGTLLAYKNGIMRSANLIVPGPWLREAAAQLNAEPELDVGIHLTLTSEWDRVKWRPLTPMPSLTDGDGCFPPRTRDVAADTVQLSEVEAELRAQIVLGRKLVPRASWLSTHMGAATATPALRELTLRLSREYKLPLQSDIPGLNRLRAPYSGTSTTDEKITAMVQLITGLTPGIHAMVDHPATDTPEMRRVGHAGNENVAEQRAGVLRAWTDPRVWQAVRRRNITLTSVGANVVLPQ